MTNADQLPAGDFSAWLREAEASIAGGSTVDVPCAGCTACCTSSQFVHIGLDETDTLAHVPPDLLFPAPGMADHVVLGYDERGHCPMLGDGACSIYDHRPRSCRTYDCRVLAAAGVDVDAAQSRIAARVARWTFSYPTPEDRIAQQAVRSAADWLSEHERPATATQLAVRAVLAHHRFLPGKAAASADAPGSES